MSSGSVCLPAQRMLVGPSRSGFGGHGTTVLGGTRGSRAGRALRSVVQLQHSSTDGINGLSPGSIRISSVCSI